MNKLSLHRAFSSMNLFIKANGKHKEIAKSDCSLVTNGVNAHKRPKATTKSTHTLPNDTCTLIGGGTGPYTRPRRTSAGISTAPITNFDFFRD